MEHLNWEVKDYVTNPGDNITTATILHCGKSINGIRKVCNHVDHATKIHAELSKHATSSLAKDESLILNELTDASQFFFCSW